MLIKIIGDAKNNIDNYKKVPTERLIKLIKDSNDIYYLGDTRIYEFTEKGEAAKKELQNIIFENFKQVEVVVKEVYSDILRWWADSVGGYGNEHHEEVIMHGNTIELLNRSLKYYSNDKKMKLAILAGLKKLDRENYIPWFNIEYLQNGFLRKYDLNIDMQIKVIDYLIENKYITKRVWIEKGFFPKDALLAKGAKEKIINYLLGLDIKKDQAEDIYNSIESVLNKNYKLLRDHGYSERMTVFKELGLDDIFGMF